jgi:hypothetical protein
MGQGDVLEFLEKQFKKNPQRFFTEREISESLEMDSCSFLLKKLRKRNEVEYFKGSDPNSKGRNLYLYKHKPEKDFLSNYLNTEIKV